MDALADKVEKIVAHTYWVEAEAVIKKGWRNCPPAQWIVGGYIVNRKPLKLFSKGRLLSLFLDSIILANELEDRSGTGITYPWLGQT